MWHMKILVGSLLLWLSWIIGVGLIIAGWVVDQYSIGQLGLAFAAGGGVIAIIRDNHRTRRMLSRNGENVAPIPRRPINDDHHRTGR